MVIVGLQGEGLQRLNIWCVGTASEAAFVCGVRVHLAEVPGPVASSRRSQMGLDGRFCMDGDCSVRVEWEGEGRRPLWSPITCVHSVCPGVHMYICRGGSGNRKGVPPKQWSTCEMLEDGSQMGWDGRPVWKDCDHAGFVLKERERERGRGGGHYRALS